MRAVIVDDEDLARGIIREHLASHPQVAVVAECANGFEAVKAVAELKPDLLFLDIQMPKLDGFEVLELLDPLPAIIFVTAYDSYAVRAFDVHAIDYLLKPFSKERFDEALRRATEHVDARDAFDASTLVNETRRSHAPLERILIRSGSKVHVVPVDQIDYIAAQDDYVSVHTGGRSHLKQERLSDLAKALDGHRFVRIHRSYVLNVDRLARLETYAKDSRLAILKDGVRLPVSRSGYQRLRLLL
jgi:two-component system LytT family response regulator